MKGYIFTIFIIVSFTGCVSAHDYDEIIEEKQTCNEEIILLEKELEQYNDSKLKSDEAHNMEIMLLNEELDKMREQSNEAINETTLTDDEKSLIKFYNGDYLDMYHGYADARVTIKVDMKEPLRILPSIDSPYFNRSRATYDSTDYKGDEFETGIFDGELLYISLDLNREEWALVIIDGSIGYIQAKQIMEYSNNVHQSFDLPEKFVGVDLGISVTELEDLYPDDIDYIIPKLRYFRMASIRSEGNNYFDVFYNPNTRIIDFIRVNTPEIPLKSGYKVGDDVNLVFGHYDEIYEQVDIGLNFGEEHRMYDIGNGYMLEIDGIDGKVISIIITPGYNIYT